MRVTFCPFAEGVTFTLFNFIYLQLAHKQTSVFSVEWHHVCAVVKTDFVDQMWIYSQLEISLCK